MAMLEATLFHPYYALSDNKDDAKQYAKLKYTPQVDYLKDISRSTGLMGEEFVDRFQRTYKKSYDQLDGKVQKAALVAVSVIAVAAITAATAGALSGPIAVSLFGSQFAGLSGAALTSACLAMAGGGAIAIGGTGMAGGAIAIVGGGALLGAAGGSAVALGVNTIAKSSPKFTLSQAAKLEVVMKEILLNAQQDVLSAQAVMEQLKEQIHLLQHELDEMRLEQEKNKTQCDSLQKSLDYLHKSYHEMTRFKSSYEIGLETAASDSKPHIAVEIEEIPNSTLGLSQIAKSAEQIKQTAVQHLEKLGAERATLNSIHQKMDQLAKDMNVSISLPQKMDMDLYRINKDLNSVIAVAEGKKSHNAGLSSQEIIFASIAGLISVLIDVVFVGTPEVVKIYRGGENFDGSILTKLLREIGNGDDQLSSLLHTLSEKCTVPYDISLEQDVVSPNNHRLRSFDHDPVFGLFFAVADILMGTTTCIDNNGSLRILFAKQAAPMEEKILSVFYYIGHILSDVCTARGVPIPGFFLTQFFAGNGEDNSLARIAEKMYKDGYDLRHLASMSLPVAAKDIMVTCYFALTDIGLDQNHPIANKERTELDRSIQKEKMLFLANSVATTGNTVKFLAPPSCGNPSSINIAQWYSMIQSSIRVVKAETRDKTTEKIMDRRDSIQAKWNDLLKKK